MNPPSTSAKFWFATVAPRATAIGDPSVAAAALLQTPPTHGMSLKISFTKNPAFDVYNQ